MPVPPGLDDKTFQRALTRFKSVTGDAWVFTSAEDLALYKDAYSPLWNEQDEKVASAAVAPDSAEQVREIVKIANEFRVPLYPISTGRNLGYGGAAPALSGSVVLDLKRMNKILEVDERNAYALVEPGVSYFDLYRYVKEHKLKVWIDCPDPGWGSVIGNALDHGVGYTMNPYRDHWDGHCGLEVVTGAGELVRTGMGALPGSKTWQHFKYGFGPHVDGLFSQSNFGVVTKMGVWLMPTPECYMPLWLRVWNDGDLPALVATLRALMLDRTIENVPQIWNTIAFASVLSSRSAWYDGEEPIPDSRIDEMARDLEVGRWMMRFALYGDEAVVDHKFRKVKEAFERIPGAEVWGDKHAPDAFAKLENPHERVQAGVPNLGINTMTGWYGGEEGGHIGFSPVARLTGPDAFALRDLIRGLVEERARLDYAAVLIPTNARSFIHVTMVIFDTKNEAEARRAYDTSRLLVQEAAKHGYGEYRAHLDFMDVAAEQYSFGDHAYLRFAETIKDAVDPNGILSPGKQGIWPKTLREARAEA